MSTLKVNELSTVPGSGDINFAPGTGINLSGASQVVIPADSTSNRPGSPTEGSIRVNTTNYKLEFYTGATGWKQVDAEPSQVTLTAQSGTWTVPDGITSVDVLLVGGGGSGGSGTAGGAISTGSYTVSNDNNLVRAVLPGDPHNGSANNRGLHYKRTGSGEHYPWFNGSGNITDNGYFEPSSSYYMGTDSRYQHYLFLSDT